MLDVEKEASELQRRLGCKNSRLAVLVSLKDCQGLSRRRAMGKAGGHGEGGRGHERRQPHKNHSSLRITESIVSAIAFSSFIAFIFLSAFQHFVQGAAPDSSNGDVARELLSLHPRRLLQAPAASTDTIGLACSATRYPASCVVALTADSRAATATAQDLVKILISISKQRSILAVLDSETLAIFAPAAANLNLTAVSAQCSEVLDLASYHLQSSENSFADLLLKDIQAWLGGALVYSNDCYYALTPFRPTLAFVPEMADRLNTTVELISNSLAMTDALIDYGPDATLWKPPPETRSDQLTRLLTSYSDFFPDWLGHADTALMNAAPGEVTLAPAVTVSLDSSTPSIQAAVDQAPAWSPARYVIYIKAGVYNEIVKVPKNKTNIMFVGDGINMTVITGNRNAQLPGTNTWLSPTVAVNGAGFIARGITFENTAGPDMHQAVALRVASDQSAFQSCSVVGYQDCLYSHTLRQFYKDCTIIGTIDFVFGNSAAVFQNCNLVVRSGSPGAGISTLTAQGRTDPGQNTGLVFQNCSVYGTPGYEALYEAEPAMHHVYLGRPWKTFSRTIFIYTYLSQIVHPDGWYPWNGTFALDTLFDAEYISSGPGASNLTQRVLWSSQLSLPQADIFSTQRFLQADTWLPATSVPYEPLV